jgi:hypothetical protein
MYNTDLRTFFISFQHRSTNKNFIFQTGFELVEILKRSETGIESIKEFQPHKAAFKRISKKDFLNYFNWDTETIEYLKKYYFFE